MRHPGRDSFLSFFMKGMLFVLVLVGVFGLVRLRSGITALEYGIGDLERKKVKELKLGKKLDAELASLTSLNRVGERSLDLSFPDRRKVFFVRKDEGPVTRPASNTHQ